MGSRLLRGVTCPNLNVPVQPDCRHTIKITGSFTEVLPPPFSLCYSTTVYTNIAQITFKINMCVNVVYHAI